MYTPARASRRQGNPLPRTPHTRDQRRPSDATRLLPRIRSRHRGRTHPAATVDPDSAPPRSREARHWGPSCLVTRHRLTRSLIFMQDMRGAAAGAQAKPATAKRTNDRDSVADAARDGGSEAPRDVVTGGHKEPRHTRFDRGATEAMAVTAAGATRQVLRAWELLSSGGRRGLAARRAGDFRRGRGLRAWASKPRGGVG